MDGRGGHFVGHTGPCKHGLMSLNRNMIFCFRSSNSSSDLTQAGNKVKGMETTVQVDF